MVPSTSTLTPDLGVSTKFLLLLIVPSYLWMECPQQLVETCNSKAHTTVPSKKVIEMALLHISLRIVIPLALSHNSTGSVIVSILLPISGFRCATADKVVVVLISSLSLGNYQVVRQLLKLCRRVARFVGNYRDVRRQLVVFGMMVYIIAGLD